MENSRLQLLFSTNDHEGYFVYAYEFDSRIYDDFIPQSIKLKHPDVKKTIYAKSCCDSIQNNYPDDYKKFIEYFNEEKNKFIQENSSYEKYHLANRIQDLMCRSIAESTECELVFGVEPICDIKSLTNAIEYIKVLPYNIELIRILANVNKIICCIVYCNHTLNLLKNIKDEILTEN